VEILRKRGVNREVKPHRKADSVEAGAEVRGGRWQPEVKRLALNRGGHAGWGWFLWDSLI